MGPGSGMDESLTQVQAALAASGAAVPAAFATPDQGGYTVEQLRAWLRANGVEAQAHVDFLEDTGKIVGDERVYMMEMTLMVPGSAPEKLQRSGRWCPWRDGAAAPGHDPAGQGGGREPPAADRRMGQGLSAASRGDNPASDALSPRYARVVLLPGG